MSTADTLTRSFVRDIKLKKERCSSSVIVNNYVTLLRKIISTAKPKSINELLVILENNQKYVSRTLPSELALLNVSLMISKIARDDQKKGQQWKTYDSLYNLWKNSNPVDNDSKDSKKFLKDFVENVKEFVTEITSCRDMISSHAEDIIQNQDVLLVHGMNSSETLRQFVTNGLQYRKFRVFNVVSSDTEKCPDYTTQISLCDVGTKMMEATKVVISCVAVFPDGSCLVPAGCHSVALAAYLHNVPVYVLAPFYKITPFFIPDPAAMNTFQKRDLPYSTSKKLSGFVEIIQPAFDLIPAKLVTLFISNTLCIIPAHINRLKEDYYHPEDISIC